MKAFIISLLFLVATNYCYAQAHWEHVGRSSAFTMANTDDKLWVGTFNGLVVVDKTTGEESKLQSWNSPLIGSTISDITTAPDGSIWLGISNGPLTKYKLSLIHI